MKESDTPRSGGGLMSWTASKAVGHWFRRRAQVPVRRDGDSVARRRSPIWERQGHLHKLATREDTIIRKPATRFSLPVEKAFLSCRFDADCFFSGFERVVGSLRAHVRIGEFHMSLLTDLKQLRFYRAAALPR